MASTMGFRLSEGSSKTLLLPLQRLVAARREGIGSREAHLLEDAGLSLNRQIVLRVHHVEVLVAERLHRRDVP
jgi:hypothetical protein